jgi:hypothetical protein
MKAWESQPFQNSFSALALMGMRWAGAEGYAFFKRTEAGVFRRGMGCGTAIHEDVLERKDPVGFVRYPLRTNDIVEAMLVFALPDPPRYPESRSRLEEVTEIIGSLWAAGETMISHSDLLQRVSALEAELLDSKIADRVRGMVESGSDFDSLEVIAVHVERVLQQAESKRILEKTLADLEEQVAARRTTALAKTILRSSNSMSEEQAHAYLRTLSRRSRRRLRDVAIDVIEKRGVLSHSKSVE